MGNNFCYSKSGMQSTMSQLLCQQRLNGCDVILTAGNIEKEQVDCIVQPTDEQFSNVPQTDKPTFIPTNGNCIFVGSTKKNKKNYILAVVQETNEISIQDQQDEERQLIYETIQNCLKMVSIHLNQANARQMRSVAFPVFQQKDHTTSATIMIMAIKLFINEQKSDSVNKIFITLNQIEQVSTFKWVFQQVFEQLDQIKSKSYSSSINTTFMDEYKSIRQIQQQTVKEGTP
ncbi:unnamed protein product (macronuclear) [Paramecium tetraurelia]|uniref:Macro domain-containing protein n=1 Tax=Paramecium tetraurelia TaxID=5888 RepID=A0BF89_PARTE|nr:uncharacterized protein GSPATT00028241001 [Paramecium tetraurelia]CAK57206.1 unnamed protein product [Paramecium tetraurelia]|eukprot:XP_001424604.1 hypothetical protein (macronuclear) [Paramecium tetraurelia strain d4-2]